MFFFLNTNKAKLFVSQIVHAAHPVQLDFSTIVPLLVDISMLLVLAIILNH